MKKIRYRVEEIGENESGDILWVETVKYFDTLESARAYVNTTTVSADDGINCYFTIWKITTTTTIEEVPVE